MPKYYWTKADLDDGYSQEDWLRLQEALHSHMTVNWTAVATWTAMVVISVAFWAIVISKVFIPMLNVWGGK